ncbi:N-acetyltransferase 8-like isoform X1 [Caloenas nicobarica]|uniref:N-acetyltransferase 8-like isoform X1 n=2 Tax=Caloenas nicobarica TaxID=187106 RepID=UPI0032B7841E
MLAGGLRPRSPLPPVGFSAARGPLPRARGDVPPGPRAGGGSVPPCAGEQAHGRSRAAPGVSVPVPPAPCPFAPLPSRHRGAKDGTQAAAHSCRLSRCCRCRPPMASFRVRQYRDQDYEAVRSLFARGLLEHVPAVYRFLLRSARAQLALLVLFAAVRAAAGSWLLALAAVALAMAATWPLVRSVCVTYVQNALSTDLADIEGSYMRAPDSCFWVAEAGGAVVGMVAVAPPQNPAERGTALELLRMSVSKEYRGRGVSKALCGEVLRFARARGYGAVVLATSMVQVAAQRLYERHGFRKVAVTGLSPLGDLLCIQIFRYRCDLPGGPADPPR